MPATMAPDELSATFAALADPTRRAILARLADGDATVTELAQPFALTQQAVSKHLQVLERAGLIGRGRAAQRRPCSLRPERLESAVGWIERHRALWAERYDQLDEHLTRLQGPVQEGSVQRNPGLERPETERYDRLDEHLTRLQSPVQEGSVRRDPGLERPGTDAGERP
jgi:DNA-binding transcriptional ArsR family regulator